MDFSNAVKRPFSDFKGWIIGCALNILPIVNFLSIGYIGEAAKLALKKKQALPKWENWGDLFIQGLLMVVISLIYALPAFIFAIIGMAIAGVGFAASMMTASPAAMLGSLLVMGPFIIIALLLMLFAGYLSPAALLGYLSSGRFGSAFSFGVISKKVFTGKYFLAWLVSIFVMLVLTAVLMWLPFVGAAIAGFTGYMIGITLLAEAY